MAVESFSITIVSWATAVEGRAQWTTTSAMAAKSVATVRTGGPRMAGDVGSMSRLRRSVSGGLSGRSTGSGGVGLRNPTAGVEGAGAGAPDALNARADGPHGRVTMRASRPGPMVGD